MDTQVNNINLLNLPADIIRCITLQLPFYEVINMQCTCKYIQQVLKHPNITAIYTYIKDSYYNVITKQDYLNVACCIGDWRVIHKFDNWYTYDAKNWRMAAYFPKLETYNYCHKKIIEYHTHWIHQMNSAIDADNTLEIALCESRMRYRYNTLIIRAAKKGTLNAFKYLSKRTYNCFSSCLQMASSRGHYQIVDICIAYIPMFRTRDLEYYVHQSNYLHFIKHYEDRCNINWRKIYHHALDMLNLEIIEYCSTKTLVNWNEVLKVVVSRGSIKDVKFCENKGAKLWTAKRNISNISDNHVESYINEQLPNKKRKLY